MTAVIDRPLRLPEPERVDHDHPVGLVRDTELADDGFTDDQLADDGFTDDELTALALAADPELAVDADGAVPWSPDGTGLLPDWYMPAGIPRSRRGWHRVVALAVVVGLVAINAAGLCITYGHLVVA